MKHSRKYLSSNSLFLIFILDLSASYQKKAMRSLQLQDNLLSEKFMKGISDIRVCLDDIPKNVLI